MNNCGKLFWIARVALPKHHPYVRFLNAYESSLTKVDEVVVALLLAAGLAFTANTNAEGGNPPMVCASPAFQA